MATYQDIIDQFSIEATPARAERSQQYLQAFPGGYGYPDQFCGLTNPQVRQMMKQAKTVELSVVEQLWCSELHEVRLLAAMVINEQYRRDHKKGPQFYQLYVQHAQKMNNWDLVDTLGPHFIGPYLYEQQAIAEVWRLAKSSALFEQRMAIISQFAWIRHGEDALLYELAIFLLDHPHDLMHKAIGWLLREAGKRNEARLYEFLDQYTPLMPRTMLRYAIEKFPEQKRKAYLTIKKQK
ncbi:MAG: DNA alkylation repair protein [Culicoidibacterales bacterium]